MSKTITINLDDEKKIQNLVVDIAEKAAEANCLFAYDLETEEGEISIKIRKKTWEAMEDLNRAVYKLSTVLDKEGKFDD